MVRFKRADDRTEIPDELIDLRLMQRFPGKTLEELDQIDWLRFCRVLEVEQRERVEDRRAAFLAQKGSNLSDDEWLLVKEHDRWLDETG